MAAPTHDFESMEGSRCRAVGSECTPESAVTSIGGDGGSPIPCGGIVLSASSAGAITGDSRVVAVVAPWDKCCGENLHLQ